jgi:chromatin remodeling complex protein RSC6
MAKIAVKKPTPVLAAIIGADPLPFTQATKKLWEYIRKNGLQDKVNRRQINCDEKLQALFGGDSINMFAMSKIVMGNLK